MARSRSGCTVIRGKIAGRPGVGLDRHAPPGREERRGRCRRTSRRRQAKAFALAVSKVGLGDGAGRCSRATQSPQHARPSPLDTDLTDGMRDLGRGRARLLSVTYPVRCDKGPPIGGATPSNVPVEPTVTYSGRIPPRWGRARPVDDVTTVGSGAGFPNRVHPVVDAACLTPATIGGTRHQPSPQGTAGVPGRMLRPESRGTVVEWVLQDSPLAVAPISAGLAARRILRAGVAAEALAAQGQALAPTLVEL